MMESPKPKSEFIPLADNSLDGDSSSPGEQALDIAAVTVRERPEVIIAAAPSTINSPTGSRLLAALPQEDVPVSNSDDSSQPRLIVVHGERLNISYMLLEGKNYIGRSAELPVDVDLVGQEPIERIWSSRQHAVITWQNGQAVLEDLNSLNGTFVNRVRVHPGQKRVLQVGDVIQIGTVQLRFLL